MSADLPRRPFTHLAPPADGLAAARAAGRRRLRVKAAAAATSGAGALAVVLGLLSASALPGQDSLRVTRDPATPGASSTALPSPAPSRTAPAAGSAPEDGARPTATATSPAADRSESSPPLGPAEHTAGPGRGAYRSPDLVRQYFARNVPLGSAASLCGGTTTNEQGEQQSTVNWCHSARVVATPRGHDLVGELCRDGTSGKQLSYDSAQEVDLLVLRAGRVVWRWSTGRAFAQQAHALQVERDHCWTWTAPWTDVDGDGKPLSAGEYQLRVVNRAAEMAAEPAAEVTFKL